MTKDEITPMAFVKAFVNEFSIGDIVTKPEIKRAYRETCGNLVGLPTVYTYIGKLLMSGHLEATETPGCYRVAKHIDEDATYNDITNAAYRKSAEKHSDTNPLDTQVGGSHYKGMKYQPLQLACDINLSFVQGNIIKYVSCHKSKNGLQDLEKAKHYAEVGKALNHFHQLPKSAHKNIFEFCDINKLDDIETQVVRLACDNKFADVIVLCEALIVGYSNK